MLPLCCVVILSVFVFPKRFVLPSFLKDMFLLLQNSRLILSSSILKKIIFHSLLPSILVSKKSYFDLMVLWRQTCKVSAGKIFFTSLVFGHLVIWRVLDESLFLLFLFGNYLSFLCLWMDVYHLLENSHPESLHILFVPLYPSALFNSSGLTNLFYIYIFLLYPPWLQTSLFFGLHFW